MSKKRSKKRINRKKYKVSIGSPAKENSSINKSKFAMYVVYDFSFIGNIADIFENNLKKLQHKFFNRLESKYENKMSNDEFLDRINNAQKNDDDEFNMDKYINENIGEYKLNIHEKAIIKYADKFNQWEDRFNHIQKTISLYLERNDSEKDEIEEFIIPKVKSCDRKVLESIKYEQEIFWHIESFTKTIFKQSLSRNELAKVKGFFRDFTTIPIISAIIEIVHYNMMFFQEKEQYTESLIHKILLQGLRDEKKFLENFIKNKTSFKIRKLIDKDILEMNKEYDYPIHNVLINEVRFKDTIQDIFTNQKDWNSIMTEMKDVHSKVSFMLVLIARISVKNMKNYYHYDLDPRRKHINNRIKEFMEDSQIPFYEKCQLFEINDEDLEKIAMFKKFFKKYFLPAIKELKNLIINNFNKIDQWEWTIIYSTFLHNSLLTSISGIAYLMAYKENNSCSKKDLKRLLDNAFDIEIHYYEKMSKLNNENFVTWLLWSYEIR